MLNAFSILLVCQLAGEALAHLSHLPVPGPLIGMLILLGWLIWRRGPSEELERFSRNLLSWLAMLFVPAATGLVTGLHQLAADWWRIGAAIFVSTFLGLCTTGLIMDRLSRDRTDNQETQ
ncbi:CidA/LrgA family protein [Paraburkholderia silviterrae]|uniref:CidA/LrgA family protein n=1 Tax=Paraburkholderia silviterrae TaxID=2528715 RepID=A0A4R5M8L1_9BURK|nr:CidA/LrgA family protein [Paraburkholderia silviterrae]TDG22796.1 CidA/LrgA family protein [Paraburkholderia silviterrae]